MFDSVADVGDKIKKGFGPRRIEGCRTSVEDGGWGRDGWRNSSVQSGGRARGRSGGRAVGGVFGDDVGSMGMIFVGIRVRALGVAGIDNATMGIGGGSVAVVVTRSNKGRAVADSRVIRAIAVAVAVADGRVARAVAGGRVVKVVAGGSVVRVVTGERIVRAVVMAVGIPVAVGVGR